MIELHFYILLSSNVPFAIVLEVYALFLHYVYGITNHKFPVHFKLEIPPFPLMDFGGFGICYTRGSPKPSTSEKNSVAICWGSNHNLTGLKVHFS